MAASIGKIFCCKLLSENSTQTVRNVYLSRFSGTDTVRRYLSTSKHMKRSNHCVPFFTNHKLFCESKQQKPKTTLLQLQPALKCVQTSQLRPFSSKSDGENEKKVKPIFRPPKSTKSRIQKCARLIFLKRNCFTMFFGVTFVFLQK